MAEKVQENRARRMAGRQGLVLVKSRRRDPNALDFGTFSLIDASSSALVFPPDGGRVGFGAGIDEIEKFLRRPRAKRSAIPVRRTRKGGRRGA